MENSAAQMREELKGRESTASVELALCALEASQSGGQWPIGVPIGRERLESILTGEYEAGYEPRAGESPVTARVRLLLDRIEVEGAKRKLFWAYVAAFPEDDPLRIKKAEEFAESAHKGQFRDSGEPYITHPLAVADILLRMGMDGDTVIAGLLHDSVEDNSLITVATVTKAFDSKVAALVDGVTKLTNASFTGKASREQAQAENVRKMFLAMAKDVRVIPIKLADRLHNMRTLEYCRSEKRERKARETLEIYAPLAHRLGMGRIKCELEDLSFMHIEPQRYEALQQRVQAAQEDRRALMEEAMAAIRAAVEEAGIKDAVINGRPKHVYSIYKKLVNQGISFEEVYDLIAIRVIVKSVTDCYHVLGIVHSMWRPLPNRIKDYIATPKPNGYKSLHTTLIGENGLPFEVQIRTDEMHRMAEFGIAAHWKYKEGRAQSTEADMRLEWLRTLMDESTEDSGEFMKVLKLDFFSDYVFVFTPEGDIVDLVTGSTPIDFAYRIHSQVGNRCVGAKVNNKIVSLDYKLEMGDIVEILTSQNVGGPRRDWLNIAVSRQAQNKIKAWFKKELKEENITRGKELLEKELRKQGHTLHGVLNEEQIPVLFKKLSLVTAEDLFAAVGYGSVTLGQVVPRLLEEVLAERREAEQRRVLEELQQGSPKRRKSGAVEGVVVRGDPGMLVRIARCCSPVPGDRIVGYVTRGRGVSVHRADCTNLIGLSEGEVRFIDVQWAGAAGKFVAHVQVEGYYRSGLMMDISKLFINMNIDLTSISAKTDSEQQWAKCFLEFEVRDAEHLDHVIKQVKKVTSVVDVYRQ